MIADPRFLGQPPEFWANVKLISQKANYTERGTGTIKQHSIHDIRNVFKTVNLKTTNLIGENDQLTPFGIVLIDYFKYRADVLNNFVKVNLMDAAEAKKTFEDLRAQLKPTCPLPMNKQKAAKQDYAFFTCIINTLIQHHLKGLDCNFDPKELTSFTHDSFPVRTLSRRVDGTFPGTVDPKAIWEIKEYYYTTTFGSRVADGVYETMLDGLELIEVRKSLKLDVEHYLMIDDYNTWWNMGRSYLCRMIDMLHMGVVSEILFGREVLTRLPLIVANWIK